MRFSTCLPGLPTHPGARILLWLLCLFACQELTGGHQPQLMIGSIFWLLLLLVLPAKYRTQVGFLLRRTRWLLISLFLVFALATPGSPLLDTACSPSHEGVIQGLAQLLRLTLILTSVAILLASTPIPALMAGCHQLLRPFLPRASNDRLVIRLLLVLHYAEKISPASAWQQVLNPDAGKGLAAVSGPEIIELHLPAWRTTDWLWPLTGTLLAAGLMISGLWGGSP